MVKNGGQKRWRLDRGEEKKEEKGKIRKLLLKREKKEL